MKKVYVLGLVFIMLMSLAGCQQSNLDDNSSKESEEFSTEKSSQVENQKDMSDLGYNDFVEVLSDGGFGFAEEGEFEDSFFTVDRQTIILDDGIIEVYEYDTKENLETDAKGISEDGCSISTENVSVEISWIECPHFFKNNKLILNYVGENQEILKFLNDTFGNEFAGYDYMNLKYN